MCRATRAARPSWAVKRSRSPVRYRARPAERTTRSSTRAASRPRPADGAMASQVAGSSGPVSFTIGSGRNLPLPAWRPRPGG
ncbi:MAG: hypothetical protein AMK72_09345 [Planctomycetes bacterium SM23_25]|nr:MAG: hypothetical protein AMK72_09345 [Planctomycetes bacterium SM23_25]